MMVEYEERRKAKERREEETEKPVRLSRRCANYFPIPIFVV